MHALRLLMLLLACGGPVWAAATGKLVVRIHSTGQALPGATLQCLDPARGAAANLDGEAFLLGLPPGLRKLRLSHLGHATVEAEAWIISGETTRLEVDLPASGVQAKALTVRAERLALPLDRTARMAVVDGQRMKESPARDVESLLTLEAGLSRDDQGGLHVRGGRRGELRFLVDGVEVQDPWSGAWQGLLVPGEVQELVLVSGAFNAEYGDAMSGVVNIVNRHTAPRVAAHLRYESPGLLASPWRQRNAFSGVVDEEAWSKHSWDSFADRRLSALHTGMPGRMSLGVESPLGGGWEARLALSSQLEESPLPHGWLAQGDAQATVGRALGKGRMDISWERGRRQELGYSHVWKYLPGGQGREWSGQDRLQLVWSHGFSPQVVGTLRAAWQRHQSRSGWLDSRGGLVPLDQWQRPVYRSEQDFYRQGNATIAASRQVEQWRVGGDVQGQLGMHHEWKSGAELRRDDVESSTIHNVWAGPASAEWFHDGVQAKPVQGAFYLQDKLEFPHLVVNAGLRLDWRDSDASWVPDPLHPYIQEGGETRLADAEAVEAQSALSPRLGLAFPFGDQAVLHAAWGEFLQFAPLQALYGNRGHQMDYARVPLMGNPHVKPQRTTAWEMGLKHELEDGARVEVAAWYKDLRDLLSTREVLYDTRMWVVYHNTDYANVRGVDFSYSRPLGEKGLLKVDYTWMSARGNGAEPESGLIRAENEEEEPFNEFPLDYEQAHDLAASFMQGLPLGFSLDVVAEAGSGLPYTPFVDVGVQVPTNSARRPWTLRCDGTVRWRGTLHGGELEVWLSGQNLLDRRNVVMVHPATGKPFDDPRGLIGSSPDALHDPSHVDAPRQVRLGMEWAW